VKYRATKISAIDICLSYTKISLAESMVIESSDDVSIIDTMIVVLIF